MRGRREVVFRGNSLADLKLFPPSARERAGRQLERVQWGEEPADWKPMTMIGSGVRELRIRDEDGIYRLIYVARFTESIFVLHCFQKKTQRTARADIELATRRYKELVKEYRR
jgi:phage-related protein